MGYTLRQPVGHTFTLSGIAPSSATVGTWGISGANNMLYTFNSSPAQNDSISYSIGLATGTWTLNVFGYAAANHAIVTIAVNGTNIGTWDQYAAAGAISSTTQTGIVIPGSQSLTTVKLTATAQNASATGWYAAISQMNFRRTA
jgi:hypothetical protein